MVDFKMTTFDYQWDLEFDGSDILLDDSLRTAIIVSLDTDAMASIDDEIPDGSDDRRGCWTDEFNENIGDSDGNTVWCLSREKINSHLLRRIKQKYESALQWMIEDGVSDTISVSVSRYSYEIISIVVSVKRPGEIEENHTFYYNWQAQIYGSQPNEVF